MKIKYFIATIAIISVIWIIHMIYGSNFDKKKAHEISLRVYVKSLLLRIADYSNEFGDFPANVASLPNYVKECCLEKSKLTEGSMYYSKTGFSDQTGKKWLVVLTDKMNSGQYCVGTIDKGKQPCIEEITIITNDNVLAEEISRSNPDNEYGKKQKTLVP